MVKTRTTLQLYIKP